LACLNRIVKYGQGKITVEDWLFVAQVQKPVGNVKRSRTWLEKCRAWLETSPRDFDWQNRLGTQLLNAKATRLLSE